MTSVLAETSDEMPTVMGINAIGSTGRDVGP